MVDRPIWRGVLIAAVVGLASVLVPGLSFAFPQSTETSGEIATDLNGTWLVVNRIEFPKMTATPTPAASPAASGEAAATSAPTKPAASPAAAGGPRPFTVAYLFAIKHIPTEEAQKVRDVDKAQRQAAIDKATKILAEEQKKAGAAPQPVASGETPVEPKVIGYGIPRAAESVVDTQDEVLITLLDVDMPKAIQEQVDKANKEEKPWQPADKDLALLKSSWKTLKPRAKTEYSRIQWKVLQDKYLEGGMLQDDYTKNAKFVISGDASLISSPGQANRSIMIYGADTIGDGVIEGGHVRAIMTAAPFPIPIDMKGHFKMYRLTDAPKAAAKKGK
jgi:hypothetical protein